MSLFIFLCWIFIFQDWKFDSGTRLIIKAKHFKEFILLFYFILFSKIHHPETLKVPELSLGYEKLEISSDMKTLTASNERSCIEAVCNFSAISITKWYNNCFENLPLFFVTQTYRTHPIGYLTLRHISQYMKDMIMRCLDLLHLMSMIYYICLEIVLV